MTSHTPEIRALQALSPLDGRYASECEPLARFFSEFALIRARVRVEIDWLLFLAGRRDVPDCPALSAAQREAIHALGEAFDLPQALRVKQLEAQTRHDVKAVELHLGEELRARGLDAWIPWLHFGCTSEDINSVAQAQLLTAALHHPLTEAWDNLLGLLETLAHETADLPMLARTHGQPASPTTMGKEVAVFTHRLRPILDALHRLRLTVKFGGATGNFSAWVVACPEADWLALTREFLAQAAPECDPLDVTTQIDPHDRLAELCFTLVRLASVLLDLARDFWQYISDGFFVQRPAPGQVGSSAMPHKVNPIHFENAEGNLGLATALLLHFATKLPVSRLQRDLSDSTVMRSVGTALGHLHLALTNLQRGLGVIQPDPEATRAALSHRWELLAEPLQTCLRRAGVADAHEKLRRVTQGLELDEAAYHEILSNLPLPKEMRERLKELRPETYLGLASDLARRPWGAGPGIGPPRPKKK